MVGARSVPEMWEDASSLAAAAPFPGDDAAFVALSLLLSFPQDLPFCWPLMDSLLLGGVPFMEVPLDFGPGNFFAVAGLLGLTRDPNGPSWSVFSFCST